jgi:hypothetical protein
MATRRTQPYRGGAGRARPPGSVLYAMIKGSTAFGTNPADVARQTARRARKRGV